MGGERGALDRRHAADARGASLGRAHRDRQQFRIQSAVVGPAVRHLSRQAGGRGQGGHRPARVPRCAGVVAAAPVDAAIPRRALVRAAARFCTANPPPRAAYGRAARARLCLSVMATAALPLFHLYGDPPGDQLFDFIHVETIAARSTVHDWTIRAHRHRDLFQMLLIEAGGGEMAYETAALAFAAPAVLLVPPRIAHGFRFAPQVTAGWVVSFSEDVAGALGDRSGEALERLTGLAADPVVPLGEAGEIVRLSALCRELQEEGFLAREGHRLAMRALLALIAIEVVRLAASRARTGAVTLAPADVRIEDLRRLVDANFRKERLIRFYAERLNMTPDRLNDHAKRATGVTAGHLIRQRVLTEAKRQVVFTGQAIHEIACGLHF